MIEPGAVVVAVNDGVVTLTGRTRSKTTALAAVRLTEAVPGVIAVFDRLTLDIDDTVAAPTPRPAAQDRLRGWWTHEPPAVGTGQDRVRARHAHQAARSEALR
jgi:hypothetical protein